MSSSALLAQLAPRSTRARAQVLDTLRRSGAVSAERAVRPAALPPLDLVALAALERERVVRRTPDDRVWVDDDAAARAGVSVAPYAALAALTLTLAGAAAALLARR